MTNGAGQLTWPRVIIAAIVAITFGRSANLAVITKLPPLKGEQLLGPLAMHPSTPAQRLRTQQPATKLQQHQGSSSKHQPQLLPGLYSHLKHRQVLRSLSLPPRQHSFESASRSGGCNQLPQSAYLRLTPPNSSAMSSWLTNTILHLSKTNLSAQKRNQIPCCNRAAPMPKLQASAISSNGLV